MHFAWSMSFILLINVVDCRTDPISCTLSRSKYCYFDEGITTFKKDSKPAPSPRNLELNGSEATWTQRKSQISDVEGYLVELVARGLTDPKKYRINATAIMEMPYKSEVTFVINDVESFYHGIKLQSLPLYNENSRDYFEYASRVKKKSTRKPVPRNRITTNKETAHSVIPKEKDDVLCTNLKSKYCYVDGGIAMHNHNSVPAPFPSIIKLSEGEDGKRIRAVWMQKKSQLYKVEGYLIEMVAPSTTISVKFRINASAIMEISNKTEVNFAVDDIKSIYRTIKLKPLPSDDFDNQDHYMKATIELPTTTIKSTMVKNCYIPMLLGIASSSLLQMVVTFVVITIRRRRKRKRKDISPNVTEHLETYSTITKRVLILTNPSETGSRDFYKKVALCLANTLQSCREFDVSCNLWMTESISKKGIAIWAHDMMKTHEKVIILCNPETMIVAEAPLLSEESESNAYLQLIRHLVRSAHTDATKFLIACVENAPHSCFRALAVPTLENCKQCSITENLINLVNALDPLTLKRHQVDNMSRSFNQVMQKLKVQKCYDMSLAKQTLASDRTRKSHRDEAIKDKLKLLGHEDCYNTQRHRYRSQTSDCGSQIPDEAQYDSVYSSRCNSHSTETLSSGEDTGFCDNSGTHGSSRSSGKFHRSGARPKKSYP